jgi:hypothetical protein
MIETLRRKEHTSHKHLLTRNVASNVIALTHPRCKPVFTISIFLFKY